jgi:putative FmdB family regulatory protein
MPNYDYLCEDDACGHTFEAFQNMTSDALKGCPKCQKDTLRRLIGKGSGIIFKGSGFYATDYRKVKPPIDL